MGGLLLKPPLASKVCENPRKIRREGRWREEGTKRSSILTTTAQPLGRIEDTYDDDGGGGDTGGQSASDPSHLKHNACF